MRLKATQLRSGRTRVLLTPDSMFFSAAIPLHWNYVFSSFAFFNSLLLHWWVHKKPISYLKAATSSNRSGDSRSSLAWNILICNTEFVRQVLQRRTQTIWSNTCNACLPDREAEWSQALSSLTGQAGQRKHRLLGHLTPVQNASALQPELCPLLCSCASSRYLLHHQHVCQL